MENNQDNQQPQSTEPAATQAAVQNPAPQPATPAPNAVTAPAPGTPAAKPKLPQQGLIYTLIITSALFCIPALIGVAIYVGKCRKAVAAGDTVAAQQALTAIKLWGFIGTGLGLLLFIGVIAGGGS